MLSVVFRGVVCGMMDGVQQNRLYKDPFLLVTTLYLTNQLSEKTDL